MTSGSYVWVCSILAITLCSCSTTYNNTDLAAGSDAYEVVPANVPVATSYAIRPKDKLRILVFGEPELSADKILVDNAGKINPLATGELNVAGKSTDQVAAEISARLAIDQLVDPLVTVSVTDYAPRWITVEGEVEKAGVFEIQGKPTLLTTVAQAGSPTDIANVKNVIVLRKLDGEEFGAKFNLARVRAGLDPDPIIMDGDVVVVGQSTTRVVWQNVLQLSPMIVAFTRLTRK